MKQQSPLSQEPPINRQGSSSVTQVIAEAIASGGHSYRRLAAELGCDHAYLNNIVKGRQNPPKGPEFYERLAAALGSDHRHITEWRRAHLASQLAIDANVDVLYTSLSTTGDGQGGLTGSSALADDGAAQQQVDIAPGVAVSGEGGATEGQMGLVLDDERYLALVDQQAIDLTFMEYELLRYFVDNPLRVLTREVLLNQVWGYDYMGGTRTVDVHVRRLRAKLGSRHSQSIETVRNVGYRYAGE